MNISLLINSEHSDTSFVFGVLGLVCLILGSSIVSLALWPHFINVFRTWNTVGLNPIISIFHALVSLLLVIAATFMIPGASASNLANPELLRICGVFLLFFNLIPLFGHSLVAILKTLNFLDARKQQMTESQYYEEKMLPKPSKATKSK